MIPFPVLLKPHYSVTLYGFSVQVINLKTYQENMTTRKSTSLINIRFPNERTMLEIRTKKYFAYNLELKFCCTHDFYIPGN